MHLFNADVPPLSTVGSFKPRWWNGVTDLILGIILHKKHIDDGDFVDEAMSFEFLSHPRSDYRDGEGHGIHGLDLGGLRGEKNRDGPNVSNRTPELNTAK